MAYYPDLSPYTYTDGQAGLVNVGWLARDKPFPKGIVNPGIVTKIGDLCKTPTNLMRGFHTCPWCEEPQGKFRLPTPTEEDYLEDGQLRMLGNGEIHVAAGGIYWTYAAPTLIYHYILRHQYLPPKEFLDAVERLIG